MSIERNVNSTIRTSLINNEPFEYAHLVKFERPQLPNSDNTFSTNANKFAYLTDGARDITFNDGSTNDANNLNGNQIYRANKLLKVTGYKESMQAKASNMTLVLASEVLGSTASVALTFAGTTITSTTAVDFVEEGFKEGDKIKLEANDGSGSNHNKTFVITGFTHSNQRITIDTLDDSFTENSTGEVYNVSLESEEIRGPLITRGTDLANPSFLNKHVEVHKVFIKPETGEIIGNSSILIFRGLITKTNINEDPTKSSRVSWVLNSHWADFDTIQGRMTSDEVHRALDAKGTPQRNAALRKDYADDMGFMHGDTSVNVLATYQEKYQELKIKTSKHGLFGVKTKVKTEMVDKTRDREVNLAIEMSAKYLPVVYGVRRLPGIPIFADTPANDPDTLFVAYAICEGEIEALYDIYVDGQPLICLNNEDSLDRNSGGSGGNQSSSAVLCAGRGDRGETLSGSVATTTGTRLEYPPGLEAKFQRDEPIHVNAGGQNDSFHHQMGEWAPASTSYLALTGAGTYSSGNLSDVGIRNNEQFKITTPQDVKLTFHSGGFDQEADSRLTTIATSSGLARFKRQVDYFKNNEEYWSPNHRLLDTAYVVAEITVTEENSDIPELEFVVKGKIFENYNYDYTYRHDDLSQSSEDVTDFIIGESVTFHRTSDDATLNTTTVKDIYKIAHPQTGVLTDVIRFGTRPFHTTNFNYVDDAPEHTQFYAKDASNNKWSMLTYNHVDAGSTALPSQGSVINSISTASNIKGKLKVHLADTALSGKTQFKITGTGNGQLSQIENSTIKGTYSNGVVTLDAYVNALTNADTISNGRLIESHTLTLPSNASSTNDFYNNQVIEVLTGVGAGQKRTITDYNGSTKVATLRSNFIDHPLPASTYSISGRAKDLRSGNNPAMQTLDYLVSPTYGKGLDLVQDVSLETFNNAARTCDTRSDVTISTGQAPSVGDEYFISHNNAANGTIVARGKVKSVEQTTVDYRVTFTDIYGNFQRIWANSIYYEVGDMIYTKGNLFRVTSAGYITTEPSTSNTQGTTAVNNTTFFKVGATGTTLTSFYKKYTQEYSLYDADFVKYWRYCGWQHDHQRWATRHQTNAVVETKNPLFENTKAMLEHYNGMLSYSNGKYELEIEAQEDVPADNSVYHITNSDIIGSLKVTDDPSRKSFNTVNASISDPGNKWSNTSVSFYNSDFVKADRNKVKTGNIQFSSITNYWNGRINAEKFLKESRFPLQVSFETMPKGILMKAGQIFKIDYDRFGWNDKLFRIIDLDIKPDCLVAINAVEYNDAMYAISNSRLPGVTNSETTGSSSVGSPGAPTSINATTDKFGTTILTWANSSSFINASDSTEIWANSSNTFSGGDGAKKVGEADDETTFSHVIGEEAAKYYWIRHKRVIRKRKSTQKTSLFSAYFPSIASAGQAGVSQQAAAISINITNPSMSLQETTSGSINYSGSGTDIQVLLGSTILLNDQDGSQANTSFRVSASAANITLGAQSTVNDADGNATIARFANHSDAQTDTPVITYTITVKNGVGTSIVLKRFQHFAVVTDGVVGSNGLTVIPTNGNHTFVGDNNGTASASGFECEFNISKGTTTFAYDGTSPYGDNTFRYGTLVNSNVVNAVASDGTITIASNSALLSGNTSTGSITVPIFNNAGGALLTTQIISLTKLKEGITGSRGGGVFTFEEASTSAISATNATNFVGTLTNADAVAVATAVIAASEDNNIVANDRITVSDASAAISATRVYTGSATGTASSVGASDFSSVVVEIIDGSAIVNGTLSANKLAANTTVTNNLNVGSNLIMGSGGKLYSTNKSSFNDADNGFYMDGTGDFHVGSSSNFIKFNQSSGLIELQANTIKLGSANVSTFGGAASDLTSKNGLLTTINLPGGGSVAAAADGTSVSLTPTSLGVTSTFLTSTLFPTSGTTDIVGGRILMQSNKLKFDITGSATTLASSGIDINAHTEQIIISDAS